MHRHLRLYLSILFFASLTIQSSCSSGESNKLDSYDYDRSSERISLLKDQITYPTDFTDAEFQLFNVNGFSHSRASLLPGASSLDYKFVIKLSEKDIDHWIDEMVSIKAPLAGLGWTREIIRKRQDGWQLHSQPEYFERVESDVTIILYRKEGVLFKRIFDL